MATATDCDWCRAVILLGALVRVTVKRPGRASRTIGICAECATRKGL